MATAILALWAATLIRLDAPFLAESWQLLQLASYGHSTFERAAFVIRDPDGAQRFVAWPFRHQSHKATYAGTVPPGTVAIIHTHPNGAPFPSEGDKELASRTGLTIYIVTRTMITRTEGRGLTVVVTGDWKRSLK